MHFRQLLIPALLVGAAMFFPDNAFAEKNELRPQNGQAPASVQESVKIDVPAKAEQVAEQAKPVNPTIPEHARENQEQANQQSAQNSQNMSTMKKVLPEQANGNGNSEGKKAEVVIQAKVDEVSEIENESESVQANHEVDKSTPESSIKATEHEEKVEPVVNPQGEDTVIIKSESDVQKPQKDPISKEDIPKVSQVLNQTQRTNSSGGQSNDRVSNGINSISLLDKWFEWNHYFEIKLVQPYLSRQVLMNTQWVNAPPSQPPQAAPLLTNVTRS